MGIAPTSSSHLIYGTQQSRLCLPNKSEIVGARRTSPKYCELPAPEESVRESKISLPINENAQSIRRDSCDIVICGPACKRLLSLLFMGVYGRLAPAWTTGEGMIDLHKPHDLPLLFEA